MRRRNLRSRGKLVILFALVGVVAGCGGRSEKLSEGSTQVARPAPLGVRIDRPPARPSAPRPAQPVRCAATAVSVGSQRIAYAAVVPHQAVARSRPGGGTAIARFGHLDLNGLPTVLGVVGMKRDRSCAPSWLHVELPVLPNGTTGWVPASAVQLFSVSSRIVVSLSRRTLKLYKNGRLMLRFRVGVGASSTPTPTGRFFVNERYVLDSANGPFGPAALGISAHSNALARVWVEHGPIGLHGTDEPWTIGEAASHGCVRLANADMLRLFAQAPAGTPVVIER